MQFAGQCYLKDSSSSASHPLNANHNLETGVLVSKLNDGSIARYNGEYPVLGICGMFEQGSAQVIYKGYEVGVLVSTDVALGQKIYPNEDGLFSTTLTHTLNYVQALSPSQNLRTVNEKGQFEEKKAVFVNFDAQGLVILNPLKGLSSSKTDHKKIKESK